MNDQRLTSQAAPPRLSARPPRLKPCDAGRARDPPASRCEALRAGGGQAQRSSNPARRDAPQGPKGRSSSGALFQRSDLLVWGVK